MILSIIVIGLIGGLGYSSMTRGFFSGMLNLICCVIAGAIAFGVWEHASLALAGVLPASGFFSFLGDSAWALGLGLPFAVSHIVLRVITDKLLPGNVAVGTLSDHIGGAACGAGAGLITAGILVMSLGFLRLDTQMSFFGYQPVDFASQGNLKREKSLIIPADKIVARLYKHMSQNALYANDSLARWYPNFEEVPHVLRVNYGGGKSRHIMRAKDVTLMARYEVKDDPKQLLRDTWQPTRDQVVQDLNGNPISGGRLEGFVLSFDSGAKEKAGQVVLGASQLRLVAEDADGVTRAYHPIAVVTQGDSATTEFGRFRYDARDVYVASVGGASEIRMGFEFLVPNGETPIALYVKHARVDLTQESAPKPVAFASASARDGAITSGQIIRTATAGELDRGEAAVIDRTGGGRQQQPSAPPPGIRMQPQLGYVIQRGTQGGLSVTDNRITDGEHTFDVKTVKNTASIDRKLRIDRFEGTPDTAIVQVDVSLNQPASLLGQAAASVEMVVPPLLVDTNGQKYEAIGFMYEDREKVQIRFTPGQPIRALSELERSRVMISRSRPDQKLTLVYRVSVGAEIASFTLGNKVILDFEPPMKAEAQR